MKRNSYLSLYFLPLCCMIVALLPACKKSTENASPPVISSIRSYVASPNDTVLHSAVANGQWVVITGQNLQNALRISFDGVPASFNVALFAPNSAVVQIPAIQFSTIDTAKLYTVEYATSGGATTFSFKLGPAAPTIAAISNVFANPGDSVHIYGTNLVLVQRFWYAGTAISSFKSSIDGTSLGFLMPAQTPSDQISIATKSGSITYKIVATPTITRVSNENATPGDSVYIYGTYLKNIQSLSFAGTSITSFVSSDDATSVGFVLPKLTQSGPVSIATKFGTAATIYKVNDVATGALSNWDDVFNWQWWGGASLTSGNPASGWPPYNPDFPGNMSQYMVLKTNSLSGGEGNTYSNYAILLNGAQWVPAANMNDPIDNWAFKFEVNIPKPWNGGTIDILSGIANSPIARWEPWQKNETATAPYATKRWITVTIPFSSFRKADPTLGEGKGASISKIADLLGPTGNSSCTVYIHNYSASNTPTGFYGAFDNLRVVKIK
jgi:hypothetical protein